MSAACHPLGGGRDVCACEKARSARAVLDILAEPRLSSIMVTGTGSDQRRGLKMVPPLEITRNNFITRRASAFVGTGGHTHARPHLVRRIGSRAVGRLL